MSGEQPVVILIVDDDGGHLELMRRSLRRFGIQNRIDSLPRGEDALDYIFCRGAHAERDRDERLLVLLDINMPGMNGIEVLRQLKADAETLPIPVIMVTTADDPAEIRHCYSLGCTAYMTKPLDPASLLEVAGQVGRSLSVGTAAR